MDRVRRDCNDLCCKPKARCFKGFMILTGIYAFASLVISLMIPPVVNNHLSQILTNPDITDPQAEYQATEDRRD